MKNSIPQDYSARIKGIRQKLGLTQARLAELMGVSFASVNRWENGQARPNVIAWRKIERAEVFGYNALVDALAEVEFETNDAVLVGQAAGDTAGDLNRYRISGPAIQTELVTSPVMTGARSAVRPRPGGTGLLNPDAGIEKIFMAGVYIREMLSRELIQRILIITPAHLLDEWEREMRQQFDLSFQVLAGVDPGEGNPFKNRSSDLTIASLEMLADDFVFALLREPGVQPYDLAILDEPHSGTPENGSRRPLSSVKRRQVAEAFAGYHGKDRRWYLPWRARHFLLLSARMKWNYGD